MCEYNWNYDVVSVCQVTQQATRDIVSHSLFVIRVSLVCVDVNLLQYKYNREVYYSPNLRSPIYSHSYQVQFSCTPVLIITF